MGAVVKTKTYKLCAIGLAMSVLTLTQARAKDQADAKPAATKPAATQPTKPAAAKPANTAMAGPGKLVPADLSYSGHGCTILMPGDYRLGEFLLPTGKLFCFKGPEHPNKKTAVFNVTIAPTPKGADIPGERAMMDIMLDPQKTGLTNYKEQKEPVFTNGGHSFKGVSFSGQKKGGEDRHGFVYLTQDKDTFFVVFAQDEAPFADHSLPILLKTTQGCQIKKAEAQSQSPKPETKSAAPKKP
jgi:hypothetical protein